jgi:hypothetical protein
MTRRRGHASLNAATREAEDRIETANRTHTCPVCEAEPGRACVYETDTGIHRGAYAHTGRYDLAHPRKETSDA